MDKYYSKFNNILFYLFLGLMVFIPLFPKIPLINVKGTFVAVRLEDFAIAGVLGLWFILNLPNLRKIVSQKITLAFLIFWFIGLVSLFSAIFVSFSVSPHLGLLNFLRRVETMSLLFVGMTTLQSRKQLKIVLVAMLIVTFLVTVYGIGQKFLGFPVISTSNSEFAKGQILQLSPGARPNSTFAGQYDLAVYLSMVLVVLGAMFFYAKKTKDKMIVLGNGLLSGALLGLTAARTAFAATFIGLVLVFWAVRKRMLIVGLVVVTILSIAAIPSLRHRLVDTLTVNILHGGGPRYIAPQPTPVSTSSAEEVDKVATVASVISKGASKSASISASQIPVGIANGEPINTTELDVERSVNIRTQVEWPRAVMAFYKNPILGTGYSSVTIATDNDFLRSLAEVGLFGTISFGLILLVIYRQLYPLLKSKDRLVKYFTLGVMVSVLVILINGIFIDVFEASKIAELFWMIIGINLALTNFAE